jgi:cobalt-zinc-cadmium efflux system outer membrane protein
MRTEVNEEMDRMSPKPSLWRLGLLLLAGCCCPVREQADRIVCEMAAHPFDVAPLALPDQSAPPATPYDTRVKPVSYQSEDASESKDQQSDPATGTQPSTDSKQPATRLSERLQVPAEIPGSRAPLIQLPPLDPNKPKEREQAINRLFPPLPNLGPDQTPAPGPDGLPLTLADLQRLALSNSPLIRQAAADVEAAKGAALQAGAYPNPTVGYEADTLGTGATAGYQGGFFDQLIKTGGKLKLAQAAATIDVLNAKLALHKAQNDLASQVRAGYFAVLVAQENIKVSRALARLTDEAFRIQVEQVKGAQAAAYEPLQLRVLTFQARSALVQARNRYTAAWKQLAATLGLPALHPTELAGRVDMPIPRFLYDSALAWVLNRNTDVMTAENTVLKNRYNLRLAQITPVPDVDVRVSVMKDFSTAPFTIVNNVTVGVPLPVWDQNKGAIIQAQGNLLRAVEEGHRVRDDLTGRLAEAFERYDNNRILLEFYRDHILPDQVRAYRGAFERHQQEPDKVSFADVVVAQQTLATTISTYITTLGAQWTAVVDVANLIQTNDLFQVGLEALPTECVAPIPDLEHLPALACCHPCNPLPDPSLKEANGNWPPAVPDHRDEQPTATNELAPTPKLEEKKNPN